MAACPLRLVEPVIEPLEGGGAKLKVRLQARPWAKWFTRVTESAVKTFELDSIGLLVWESCDGRTSVQKIIRKLSKLHHLTLREAEVPTIHFLHTLSRKGLIGMSITMQKPKGKD